jgi:hypothetical protein
MYNILVIGVQIQSVKPLSDEVAEPLAQELQKKIEEYVNQLAFDFGENRSKTIGKLKTVFT